MSTPGAHSVGFVHVPFPSRMYHQHCHRLPQLAASNVSTGTPCPQMHEIHRMSTPGAHPVVLVYVSSRHLPLPPSSTYSTCPSMDPTCTMPTPWSPFKWSTQKTTQRTIECAVLSPLYLLLVQQTHMYNIVYSLKQKNYWKDERTARATETCEVLPEVWCTVRTCKITGTVCTLNRTPVTPHPHPW
jgi:hypothetical protein